MSELANFFLDSLRSRGAPKELEAKASSLEDDLFSSSFERHSYEEKVAIVTLAAEKFLTQYESCQDISIAWEAVIRDFHRNHFGFPRHLHLDAHLTQSPAKVQNSRRSSQIFRFFWPAFQTLVLMKVLILYFGLEAAQQRDDSSYWFLGAAVLFSFGNLIYFAWKNRGNSEGP